MALLGLKLGKSAVTHFWERSKMKERDDEIEKERIKEKVMDTLNLEALRRQKIVLQHFTHHHPLHRVYLSDDDFSCSTCGVSISGWAYSCEEPGCSYFLHAVCSGSPVTLEPTMATAIGQAPSQAPSAASSSITTFAHDLQDHQISDVYSNLEFQCQHCFTTGMGRRYKCTHCDVNLHPVCAKHPTRLSTFMHPEHELELRTKKRFRRCRICCNSLSGQNALNLRVYGCDECKFWVHPMCSQLPQYLLHNLHPMTDPPHMLQLKRVESAKNTQCDAKCGSNCSDGWQYVCTICSVNFHIECILCHSVSQDTSVQDKSDNRLSIAIGVFSELAGAAGFGISDVAILFT